MARGRMLNKKISLNKAVSELEKTHGCAGVLWYTWTIAHLDVEGRIHGDPDLIKQQVCPRISGVTPELIRSCSAKAHELGLIEVYEADGDVYIQYPKFAENQVNLRKDREAKSTLPQYSGVTPEWVLSNSGVTPELLPHKRREEKRSEGKLSEPSDPNHALTELANTWPAAISTTADFEQAIAEWGWSVSGLSPRQRAKVSRITKAGVITRDEYEHAKASANGKDKPVAYFLSVVEGERKQATEEANKPSYPPKEPERSGCWARDLSYLSQRDE